MAGSESAQVPLEAYVASAASSVPTTPVTLRHSALVRITHWITTLCFLALLVTGMEIVISHPRFYWGETGNVLTTPLFRIPIPSSRSLVPTGYGYVLPDQNGWSRYLHFQAAWIVVLTGLLYVISAFFSGHLGKTCSLARPIFRGEVSRPQSPAICALNARAERKPGHTTCCSVLVTCS